MLVPRALEPVLERAASEFPAVVVTGPRQAGKTTLLRDMLAGRFGYASLEAGDLQAAATADPRGFLSAYPPPVILDEIQHAPELLPYVKEWIDRHRKEKGRFLLTGSQNLMLLERISETLAGRAAILHLLPLSLREMTGRAADPWPWEAGFRPGPASPSHGALWERVLRGGFPELFAEPDRDAALWHASYLRTYVERDVRSIRQVGDLRQFQTFLRALAARNGQILNLSSLATDVGVAVNTAKAWLSVLEATFQVILLQPWFANITKRLVKSPKVYFTDTGLLAHLVGLTDPRHAAAGPMAGSLLETAVVTEVWKGLLHRGLEPRIWYWRTATGQEVDLLVEHEGGLVPIEVKTSATPHPRMTRGIQALRADLGDVVRPGWLAHPGDHCLPLGDGITALPIASL